MNRRQFIALSSAGLLNLVLSRTTWAGARKSDKEYSIVLLGDTHFDTFPYEVYHGDYIAREKQNISSGRWAEFKRNGEMWKDRCPRLLTRAAELITPDTRMVFQVGDLVQGDCGNPEVHRKMLDDAFNRIKTETGNVPFVTVVGNHDIRGTEAGRVYEEYMPPRLSKELGKPVTKTTFAFTIGDDAYIFIDFNKPDDEETERLLKATEGARHTFLVTHGPILPSDVESCRWFYHGKAGKADTAARLHFRRLFARRNAIVLCGHTHRTDFKDWWGDGGRITEMTLSSVWSSESKKEYRPLQTSPEQYGMFHSNCVAKGTNKKIKDESALYAEYRPGLKQFSSSVAAGCYKMTVGKRHIAIDFYGGDSRPVSHHFVLR